MDRSEVEPSGDGDEGSCVNGPLSKAWSRDVQNNHLLDVSDIFCYR